MASVVHDPEHSDLFGREPFGDVHRHPFESEWLRRHPASVSADDHVPRVYNEWNAPTKLLNGRTHLAHRFGRNLPGVSLVWFDGCYRQQFNVHEFHSTMRIFTCFRVVQRSSAWLMQST